MDPINSLPDVAGLIFAHLNKKELLNATLVSPVWNQVIGSSSQCMGKLTLKFFGWTKYPEDRKQAILKSVRRYQSINVNMRLHLNDFFFELVEAHQWRKGQIFDSSQHITDVKARFFQLIDASVEALSINYVGSSGDEISRINERMELNGNERKLENLYFPELKILLLGFCSDLTILMFNHCSTLESLALYHPITSYNANNHGILSRQRGLKKLRFGTDRSSSSLRFLRMFGYDFWNKRIRFYENESVETLDIRLLNHVHEHDSAYETVMQAAPNTKHLIMRSMDAGLAITVANKLKHLQTIILDELPTDYIKWKFPNVTFHLYQNIYVLKQTM